MGTSYSSTAILALVSTIGVYTASSMILLGFPIRDIPDLLPRVGNRNGGCFQEGLSVVHRLDRHPLL